MFLDLMEKRRSIRKFKDIPVEKDKQDMLIETALRSPSSMGRNPWEFIVVTDKELLTKLSKAKQHGASFLKNAPLAIVVCADPAKCDVWIEDTSIASVLVHVAAGSLGLGSCWVQIRERRHSDDRTAGEYIAELLGVPSGMEIESVIAVGYPDEHKPGHKKEDLQYEKVHKNFYGKR
ncbi:MAG: nitroreductase family protein [Deltaproteobacteria bacterium]|nr:nitroreductase family protein [Deltaproteobacteria bacterium]